MCWYIISYGRMIFRCMDRPHFIYPLVDKHVTTSTMAVVNSAVVCVDIDFHWGDGGINPGVELFCAKD